MLRVRGETAYPATVASARVRVQQFIPFLGRQNIELDYLPSLTEAEYELLRSTASVSSKAAVLARSAARTVRRRSDIGLSLVHRLRTLTQIPFVDPPRQLDVYDFDDALFLGSPAQSRRRGQWAKQEARRCAAYLQRARLVLAGNDFLAARARAWAKRVEILPTCVDPTPQPLRTHGAAETVTIGWIGSSTTSPYLAAVLPALAAINRGRERARLVVVGGDTGVQETWIEHRRWSLEVERVLLASFDIGIMPLPDIEWAQGKCGYKLLQYFSAGVPAVASPVGVAPAMIGSERGYLAASEAEWRQALEMLIDDAEERASRGAAARKYVEQEYSFQVWAPRLADLLRSLEGH